MASTCVDSVLHDLDRLCQNSSFTEEFEILQLNLRFLRTFLLCAKKWSNNGIYLESNGDKKVSLGFFLSSIEDTVNKNSEDFHSLWLRRESELTDFKGEFSDLIPVVNNFQEKIKSFKQEIIKVYITLSGYISFHSSCCMRDDELVEFIDSLLQNLMDLLSRFYFETKANYNDVLHTQVEALEDKLSFLKNFIRFAKLRGVVDDQLEDLLTHIQFVALNATRLSYMCSFYQDDEAVRNPEMCFMIHEVVQKIKPVDHQVYETYVKVLRASKFSVSLHGTTKIDEHIMLDFNDSLIGVLWELLWCNASFVVCVKDQMQTLFEGLRFLRTILREPDQEKIAELNENIGAVISEAGIIISSLFVYEVKEGDVDSAVGDARDCYAMLVSTNGDIKLIESKISGSNMIGSIHSYHSFAGQKVSKISNFLPSKGKIPIVHEFVVSLDDQEEIIIDRLIRGSRQLEIVPIVGMPGLGKTTFAKNVYSNPAIMYNFHLRSWCCVSQIYNRRNVLLQILSGDLKPSRMDEELKNLDEDDLLEKLCRKLKQIRYLVVFDDVWDIGVWNDLAVAFPDDEIGSRILFTSRSSNVASNPHNLRPLTDTESWELLKKKIFGKEDCPQAIDGLGMEIAKNCKGLPLTIVIIAGFLATIQHDGWEEVAKSLTSAIVYGIDQCKNTLELSYNHLPTHLKHCLLYFGAFREDQEIETEKLRWLWIAEGFVKDMELKRLEDVAEEYMMDLIGRNLVMITKQRSIGGVKACCVHDLLHEFCKAKAADENFLQVLQGYDELSTFSEHPNLQRLSIYSKQEQFKKSKLFCPQLRSLLLFHQIEEYDSLMSDISFVICIYKHLRVLDMEQIFLMHMIFPKEIESLVQLRYLAVRGLMSSIPPSIANLLNLETFLVTSILRTISLPDTLWNMKKLRHLHITGWGVTCTVPNDNLENSSNLCNLDTFSTLKVSLSQRVENIMRKIPNVRHLKIQLSRAKESKSYLNITPLGSLESLQVRVSAFSRLPSDHVQFSFPLTLKELELQGSRLPWCKISLVEELPKLEVLKLLDDSFEGERWDLIESGFPELRVLTLKNLNVVEWSDNCGDDYFPCLQKLVLVGRLKLEEVPSCLGTIPTLEMIKVEDCDNVTVKSLVREIEEDQKNFGNVNLKILIN